VRRSVHCLALSLALAGCWPPSFFDYEDDAPVHVIEKPSSFPVGSFGSTLLAIEESTDGRQERLLVGSGAESPIYSFALSDGDTVLPSDFETARLCDPDTREGDAVCTGKFVGSALGRVETWGPGQICAAIGGTGDALVVACEEGISSREFEGAVNSQFGVSVAGIPGEERVLVGTAAEGAFMVARADPEGADPTPVDVGDCAPPTDHFGQAVAAAQTYWAIGSGGSQIVVVSPDGGGLAVLTTPDGGAGTLLVADLVGDNESDLVAGGGGEVRIWDGADLEAARDCDDVIPAVSLSCKDVPERSVVCGGRFGASLAVGDVNDDGHPDLLVGDPAARVSGEKTAGAAFVYAGGPDLGPGPSAALVDSRPEGGAELGRAVAVGSVLGRGEAIAGSDGEVFFFFCTGIEGDAPGDPGLDGCRPTP
jgi:FG-GAP repeat protein